MIMVIPGGLGCRICGNLGNYGDCTISSISNQHRVAGVKDIGGDVLELLVRYMYEDSIRVTEEQLGSVIIDARRLDIKCLGDVVVQVRYFLFVS